MAVIKIIKDRIAVSIQNLQNLFLDDEVLCRIVESAQIIIKAINSGKVLMICGNGGSAADAQHIAGEFVCKFYKNRKPLPAISLSTDTSVITSISNDYSYNEVFSRQVRAFGKNGDILFGISTSGGSKNIFEAFKTAKELRMKTLLLTGNEEREIAKVSDVVIKTPSLDTPRIQEMHLLIEHIICEIVEKHIFGD